MSLSLQARGLRKVFNRRVIFDQVGFEIREGQTLLVTGRNGSGKSTLVKIVSRVLTPSAGTFSLTMNGTSISELHWSGAIGLVSPYLQLYDEFSARENLLLAMTMRGCRADKGRIEALLQEVALVSRADDPVRTFSSGMKQRVKYAFALVHQPPVLILDEPMANLDGEGVALVRRLMDDQRRSGLLIVATNDLTDVASYDLRVDLHYGSGDEPLSPDARYEGLPKSAGVTPESGQPRHAIDPRIAGDPRTAEDPRNGGQSMNAAEAATGEQEGSIEPAAAAGTPGSAEKPALAVDAGKQQGGEARVHSGETGAGPWVRSVGAVFRKDWESELRTRYAISALLMFVVTTISIILFSLGSEGARAEVLSGMLWVVVFFSAMSGLSRTFVMEEERGTSMTLQLVARPSAVYFGKLLFNLVLVTGLDVLTVGLYALFINGFVIKTASIFILAVGLGGMGFAAASTIIAAIIARASTKGTLYPVLSFPILLPLLLTVINATRLASDGAFLEEAYGEFQILISYIVVVTAVSILVFDYVWKD